MLHQSGIPDLGEQVPPEAFADWDAAIARVCGLPLELDPGAAPAYHLLTGSAVLAEIVSRVSGRSFREFCDEEIFVPLGMAHTSWGRPTGADLDVSDTVGATDDREANCARWRDPAVLSALHPAIGAYSTAGDLGRFLQTWLDDGWSSRRTLLSPEVVAHATQLHVPMWEGATLGFGDGFIVGNQADGVVSRGNRCSPRTFGHPGMCSSQAYCDPELGVVVALIANVDPGQDVSDRRFSRLCDLIDVAVRR